MHTLCRRARSAGLRHPARTSRWRHLRPDLHCPACAASPVTARRGTRAPEGTRASLPHARPPAPPSGGCRCCWRARALRAGAAAATREVAGTALLRGAGQGRPRQPGARAALRSTQRCRGHGAHRSSAPQLACCCCCCCARCALAACGLALAASASRPAVCSTRGPPATR